jgi:hypothetical protein
MSHLRTHIAMALVAASTAAIAGESPTPFEEATMFVEQNATDRDTEVVIAGTAGDDGLQLLTIKSPDGRTMATLRAPDLTTLGMREFHFESPEPPGEAVLGAYPEGKYVLRGVSTEGEVFRTVLSLSHQLPAATTILHPTDEAELPAREPLIIRWSKVTGLAGYVLEFENESADPERAFTIDLGANVTSWRIPAALMVPGGEFQIGIHSVAKNRNIVVAESTFTTEE